jgi:hypothetical protein
MGLSRVLTDGTFGQIEALQDGTRWLDFYRSTPLVMGGNSGGGVFHQTEAGAFEIVSVVSRGYPSNSWMNYHVPLPVIAAYMEVVLRVEAQRLEREAAD